MPRKRLAKTTEQEVLLHSRRRCALCWGLENDLSVKKVQIAHVDHDSSNDSPLNLVALCLPHHDEYDTQPRQTKRITEAEISHFRDQLYEILRLKQRTVKASFIGQDGHRTKMTSDTRNLGMVVRAHDIDASRENPNGIKLLSLVKVFLTREGDFVACQEAIRSLARLAALDRDRCGSALRWLAGTGSPLASPIVALADGFCLIQQTDLSLSIGVKNLLEHQALRGEIVGPFTLDISEMPGPILEPYCAALFGIIAGVRQMATTEQRCDSLNILVTQFCQLTAIYAMQGWQVPTAVKRIYYRNGNRCAPTLDSTIPDDELLKWPPDAWFSVMHMIALLPQEYFELALELLSWKPCDANFLLAAAGSCDSLETSKRLVDNLLLHPVGISFATRSTTVQFAAELTAYIESRLAVVGVALGGLKQCLIDERQHMCRR